MLGRSHAWYAIASLPGSCAPVGPWRGFTAAFDALAEWNAWQSDPAAIQATYQIHFVGPFCTPEMAISNVRLESPELCEHPRPGRRPRYGGVRS